MYSYSCQWNQEYKWGKKCRKWRGGDGMIVIWEQIDVVKVCIRVVHTLQVGRKISKRFSQRIKGENVKIGGATMVGRKQMFSKNWRRNIKMEWLLQNEEEGSWEEGEMGKEIIQILRGKKSPQKMGSVKRCSAGDVTYLPQIWYHCPNCTMISGKMKKWYSTTW